MSKRLTIEQLGDKIEKARSRLRSARNQSLDLWRHKASGTIYKLHGPKIVLREHDLEPLVSYFDKGVYDAPVFVRPLDEFLEKFEAVREAKHWEVVETV